MLSVAGRLLGCILVTWLVHKAVGALMQDARVQWPLTLAWSAPLWSIAFAKYWLGLLPAIKRKAERDAMEAWNGRYYAFGTQQVRLFLVDGVIWTAANDVSAILAPLPDARELRILGAEAGLIPGQKLKGYTEAGLLRMLATRTGGRSPAHEMVRFKHWLEKEAFPNLHRLPSSAS